MERTRLKLTFTFNSWTELICLLQVPHPPLLDKLSKLETWDSKERLCKCWWRPLYPAWGLQPQVTTTLLGHWCYSGSVHWFIFFSFLLVNIHQGLDFKYLMSYQSLRMLLQCVFLVNSVDGTDSLLNHTWRSASRWSMKAVQNWCSMSPLAHASLYGHALKKLGGRCLNGAGAVAGEGAPGSAHCPGDFRPGS